MGRREQAQNESPEVRVTVFPPVIETERDLTLSYPLDPYHEDVLRRIHQSGRQLGLLECRMHDHEFELRHLRQNGRVPGAWLYVREIDDADRPGHRRLILCHWPEGIAKGSHRVPAAMSDEHKQKQEFIALRGEEAGADEVTVDRELVTGRKPDVIIRVGDTVFTSEIQVSGISRGTVLKRTKIDRGAGAVPSWFPFKSWPHAGAVPYVETNDLQGFRRIDWTISSGLRQPTWERRLGELTWEPMPGLNVGDFVDEVLTGGLVAFDPPGNGKHWLWTRPAMRDQWLDFVSGGEKPKTLQPARRPRDAVTLQHAQYSAKKLLARLGHQLNAPAPGPAAVAAVELCQACGCEMPPGPGLLCPEHQRRIVLRHLGWRL